MEDFTKGNAARQILLFSLPMLIGNLFQQIYSMADSVVVGRYVSGASLAAVGVAINLLNFLLAVLIGLTTGASVVISQFYGAKQYDRVSRAVSTSILIFAVLSVVITAGGIAFAPELITALKAPPAIFDDAVLYLRVVMGGMVFLVFFNMYTAYLRALGDSKSPLYILIFCTLLNIVLDLLLVLYFGLGVLGVGVATVVSQALSAVLCFLHTRRNVPLLSPKRLEFDPALFRAILKYGTPAAIQLSLVNLASLSIARLINSFGPAAMAGITVAARIDQIAIMPVANFALALSTFVGQNMGAGLERRAREGLRSSVLYMVLLSAGISVMLIALGPELVPLFLSEDDADAAAILDVGLKYLNILVSFYFFFGVLFAFNGFFRGAGDAVIAMVFPVSSLAIRAGAAYALVDCAGMGPEALAWSIPIGWGSCSIASWIYYKKRLWRGKAIVRHPAPAE